MSDRSHAPDLARDIDEIASQIARVKAPLKIVVKTKNDPDFIGEWIDHHGAIVGPENLIVLDNGSNDPSVLDLYDARRDQVVIARWDGFHNDIHSPWRFSQFYAALRDACDYFLFLDTDEFLTFYNGKRFLADAHMLRALPAARGDFVMTTRLNGVPLCTDRFVCGGDLTFLRDCLKWGKPIIRARTPGLPSTINHNVHFRGALSPSSESGFFVLHHLYRLPSQRVRANLLKLAARGFVAPGATLEETLACETAGHPRIIGVLIDEIRAMLAPREAPDPAALPSPGTMRIEPDGTPRFSSPREEKLFAEHLATFDAAANVVLTPPPSLRADFAIENHRLANSVFRESPNHGGEITPRVIVLHFTSTFDAETAITLLRNARTANRVSAHIVIDVDGAVTQLVPFNIAAWHAGPSKFIANGEMFEDLNSCSIGVEIANPGWFTIGAGGVFLHEGRTPCSFEKLGPFPGTIAGPMPDGTIARWACYPPTQMDVLERLVRALVVAYPSIQYVVGHEEIAPVRKVDPGPALPMARFRRLITER